MLAENSWTIISEASRWLKYGFAAATTALSILSLRHETTFRAEDQTERKRLTPAGRWYQRGVIALAALTILTTIIGDVAGSKLSTFAEIRHNEELQGALRDQLDRQLKHGFKPILDNLQLQVDQTSQSLKDKLTKQNENSTAKIQEAQSQLIADTQRSAEEMGQIGQNAVETARKNAEGIADMRRSLAEADLRVLTFSITFKFPADGAITAHAYNWKETDRLISENENRTCARNPHSPSNDDPQNPCDQVFHMNKSWRETHESAEQLYLESGFNIFVSLGLQSLGVSLNDTDCSFPTSGPPQQRPPSPCFNSSAALEGAESGNVPISLSGFYGASGAFLVYDSNIHDPNGKGILEAVAIHARDLEFRSLVVNVCGPNDADARALELSGHLPQTMGVTIWEQDRDEHLQGSRAVDIQHSYNFSRWASKSIESPSGCAETEYIQ